MVNTVPWMDIHLEKDAMEYLWAMLDSGPPQLGHESDSVLAKTPLAGNILKNGFIEDKDDWFYKNVLKRCAEHLYYKNWNNYYEIVVKKTELPPEFSLKTLWVNYQKQHEFNPPHQHEGLFSFVVFMQIPTYWKEQHALPFSAASNTPCASDFQFLLGQGHGPVQPIRFPLSPKDQGRMLFFPAWLSHQVFPFYGTEESRITISGNVDMEVQRS